MALVSNTCQAAAPGTAPGKPGRLGETDGSFSRAASGFSSEQQSDVMCKSKALSSLSRQQQQQQ